MLEKPVKIVFISIGSNLGNKKKNIESTKFELKKNKINIIKSSRNYESLSWPNKKNPKFINVVLKIKTSLSPNELIKTCLSIEKKLGLPSYIFFILLIVMVNANTNPEHTSSMFTWALMK